MLRLKIIGCGYVYTKKRKEQTIKPIIYPSPRETENNTNNMCLGEMKRLKNKHWLH